MNPQRNRGWLWFFALLVVLTLTAIIVEVRFNAGQQLTPEKLAQARQLWRENGPRDYDLTYTKKGDVNGEFFAQVRGGKVVYATMDGQPLEERLFPTVSMNALFHDIEQFLELDTEAGVRAFTTATFDPRDGHLQRFVRSVMSKRQRIEITVKLRPAEALPANEKGK
jgi:hypothetical protein